MARPKLSRDYQHDNRLDARLTDDDYAFLVAEAERLDVPKNVLARSFLHEAINRLRRERRAAFNAAR
jgi:hypothetical protein